MKRHLIFLFFAGLLVACSSSKYLTSSYERLAPGHQLIAVVPFDNIYTGRTPKDMTEAAFQQMMDEDAYFFQRVLYGQLLEESGIKDHDIHIDIQDVSTTNNILREEGVTPGDIKEMEAIELANLLGVDAVVIVTLHKEFLLSDEESVLVDVAGNIYRHILDGPFGWKTWGLDKTGNIYIQARILDGKEGVAVWALDKETSTDWRRRTDEVVADINHHISKKFPYRNRS